MIKTLVAGLSLLLLLAGCGSNKGLVGDNATSKLKPMKELEVQEATSANLLINVNNIADFSYSNKNRFELFLNKKLIQPTNKIDNATPTYVYELRLQPGYYEVSGIYYWNDGWRERQTRVKSKELVRVGQDRRTVLDIDIPKDWRGMVTDDELFFNVAYKPFFEEEEPQQETPQEVAQRQYTPGQKIQLQINTDPVYCDVIIDDQMVGQSPISIWVDNNTSHVVQIRKDNFRTITRLYDAEDLRTRDKLILIERLEPVNPLTTNNPPEKISSTDTTLTQQHQTATPTNPPATTPATHNPATAPAAANNQKPGTSTNTGSNTNTETDNNTNAATPDSTSNSGL